jgi:hypothetical protein
MTEDMPEEYKNAGNFNLIGLYKELIGEEPEFKSHPEISTKHIAQSEVDGLQIVLSAGAKNGEVYQMGIQPLRTTASVYIYEDGSLVIDHFSFDNATKPQIPEAPIRRGVFQGAAAHRQYVKTDHIPIFNLLSKVKDYDGYYIKK